MRHADQIAAATRLRRTVKAPGRRHVLTGTGFENLLSAWGRE